MKKIWDKVYYGLRWPLGWLLLKLRNGFWQIAGFGFTWIKVTMRAGIWLDQLGCDILPEKAPPDRLELEKNKKNKK